MTLFQIIFIMTAMVNLDTKFGWYFKLSFIMVYVGNINENLGINLNYRS